MTRTTSAALTTVARPAVRPYEPTTQETRWVSTWAEFRAAGGVVHFAEDQHEVALSLPEGVKFSIQFMARENARNVPHMTPAEVRHGLTVGATVRTSQPFMSEDGEGEEITVPAGTLCRVTGIDQWPDTGQGLAVTIMTDGGAVGVFDEGDPAPCFPFTLEA